MLIAFIYMNNVGNVGRGAGYVFASAAEISMVDFFDTRYMKEDEIVNTIVNGSYDLLCVSTISLLFPWAYNIIQKIKARRFLYTLVGGVHATILGSQLLERYSEIDFACVGEGETFIKKFLNKWGSQDIYFLPNLIYRKGDAIVQNNIREPEDLSLLPEFPYYLFPRVVVDEDRFLYVKATRGCPYHCSYCNNSFYLDLYKKSFLRQRPIDKVIKELSNLKKVYSPGLFYFSDEMIIANKEYAKQLFFTIKKEIDFPYGCMVRAKDLTQDLVEIMEETGCKYVAMGVECGDEDFRKKVLHRYETNEQIINAFKWTKKAGMKRTSFNMVGYPVEYDDKLWRKTKELNEIIKPDIKQVTWFYPLPGTELGDKCYKEGMVDESLYLGSYHSQSILKMHKGKKKPV